MELLLWNPLSLSRQLDTVQNTDRWNRKWVPLETLANVLTTEQQSARCKHLIYQHILSTVSRYELLIDWIRKPASSAMCPYSHHRTATCQEPGIGRT